MSNGQLASFIERIERLNEEKRALTIDTAAVFAEAKASGFDTAVMRIVIKERAMDTAKRQERDALMEVYMKALGMLSDTPLGEAALAKVA